MRPLSASQLLYLWDAGQSRHPIDRALLALALGLPEEAPDRLADHPVGWREARLLALRNATFGAQLDGYDACPRCGAMMEFSVDGDTLLAALPLPADDALIELDGSQWRLPSSRDQALALAADDPERVARHLLARCHVAGSEDISAAQTAALEALMEKLDPAANIRLGMHCSECGEHWDALLDVGSWFWDELGARARELLHAVHRLALAYGWREADILALSPARRAAYLDLIG
ncbi:MAG: phage baseplate protein [Azoarcus sp. PHD]|nr:MAG: phage baseplate protein [Azoarcus sp. PHD]